MRYFDLQVELKDEEITSRETPDALRALVDCPACAGLAVHDRSSCELCHCTRQVPVLRALRWLSIKREKR